MGEVECGLMMLLTLSKTQKEKMQNDNEQFFHSMKSIYGREKEILFHFNF